MANTSNSPFTALVALLPPAIQARAKAVAATVLAVVTAVAGIVPLATGLPVWVGTVLAAVSVVATRVIVYLTPNAPSDEQGNVIPLAKG